MKILIVRTFPDKLDINSYNVQEIGLASALTIRGHQCGVVLFNGRNQDKKEQYSFEYDKKKYHFTLYWLRGFGILKNGFMPSVKQLVEDYDIIQVHEYDQIMSWDLYTKQIKPTVIYHGPYFHPYTQGYNFKCKIFDSLFLKRRKYNDVIGITKSKLAADFLKQKGFENVVTAGVGINPDNFRTSDKNSQFKRTGRRLLYVGKIEDRRNVYFLIDVFRALLEVYSDVQLMLIGDGEKAYRDKFLKAIKPELEEGKIIYQRKASQTELTDIYCSSDIFLFTSYYDIFGMVLLEAMYFGLPVISTMNGGASTLITEDKNGYILKNFEIKKWVEKICQLLQNPEKITQMGQCAANTIESNFTWIKLAEKFEDCYQRAINEFKDR